MNKRKGISLIVLVITILVMIILAGVVVVSLSKNNPIEKAKEATFKQSLAQIGEELEMFCVNEKAQNSEFNKETLYANKNSLAFNTKTESSGQNIYDIIPSLRDSKYKNQIEVTQGMLFYRTPDKKEIPWLRELGIHYTGIVTGTVEIEGDTLVGVSPDYVNTGTLVIPNTVKKIAPGAFSGCKDLNAVVFPEGITEIPDNCFTNCSSLTSVKIPDSVKVIGREAFKDCVYLDNVKLPANLELVKGQAFYWCRRLSNVEFNSKLKVIENKGFAYCKIFDLNLKEGLEVIGEQAFELLLDKDVTIPNSVLEIGNFAFLGSNIESLNIGPKTKIKSGILKKVTSLKSFNVDANNPYHTTSNNVLYNKDMTELMFAPSNIINFTLPSTVKVISESAFAENNLLESVTIQEGTTTIGKYAFENCQNLNTLNIPSTVNKIDIRIIESCPNLTNINIAPNNANYKVYNGAIMTKDGTNIITCADINTTFDIPNTVKIVSNSAFAKCKKLQHVNIPNSVTTLHIDAFRESGLIDVIIPGSVKEVSWGMFRICKDLESVTIQEGVQTLNGTLFHDCPKLVKLKIPASVKTVAGDLLAGTVALNNVEVAEGNTMFKGYENMLLSKDGKFLYSVSDFKSVVTVPSGIETIGMYAFHNSTKINEIRFPNTVKQINRKSFMYARALRKVNIPSSIQTIENEAFIETPKLSEIIIDKPVGSISGAPWGATQGIKAIIWQ